MMMNQAPFARLAAVIRGAISTAATVSPRAALLGMVAAPAAFAGLPSVAAAQNAGAPNATTIIGLPLIPRLPPVVRSCDQTSASGLGYRILKQGAGQPVGADDVVLVNYIGFLASNGEVFDQGMGVDFPVGGVIPGFAEGLQTMTKGEVLRLCIPARLGYGSADKGAIPPNSDLVFQVELLDRATKAEIEAARAEAQARGGQPANPSGQ